MIGSGTKSIQRLIVEKEMMKQILDPGETTEIFAAFERLGSHDEGIECTVGIARYSLKSFYTKLFGSPSKR